jgi:hypothetical protein
MCWAFLVLIGVQAVYSVEEFGLAPSPPPQRKP